MTKEEAKKILYAIAEDLGTTGFEYYTCKDGNRMREAIKALDQEPVLDKIRAEIIELRSKQNVGVLECLDILDKYKAECEVQE